MKNKLIVVSSIVLITLLITCAFFNLTSGIAQEEKKETITVLGKGEVTATPDIAYIQIGLSTEGNTAQEAQTDNATKFAKITETLTENSIKKEDIKTIRFNNSPRYQLENNKNILKGYQVENEIQVTYRNLNGIGSLLDALSSAGANRVDNIQFGIEKKSDYQAEALKKAMDDADIQASALAKKSGRKVKKAIQINEIVNSIPPVRTMAASDMKSMASNSAMSSPNTDISQGTMQLSAQVEVTYEF